MKPHWLYLKYLLRHKWFVFVAGRRLGVSFWRLLIHDWSKFLPCEWFPYVAKFYGEASRLKKEESDDYRYWNAVHKYDVAFDLAWLHHQHFNKHHWQHWILRNDRNQETKVLEMPRKYAREMVADWAGAGRGITGKWEVWVWYEKNKNDIGLHPLTKLHVEAWINFLRVENFGNAVEKDRKRA